MSYWLILEGMAAPGRNARVRPSMNEIESAIDRFDHLQLFKWYKQLPRDNSKEMKRIESYIDWLADREGSGKQGTPDARLFHSVRDVLRSIYGSDPIKCKVGHLTCKTIDECSAEVARRITP